MVYVVNCRECEYTRVNDTTFDTGNASLVKDQHERDTAKTEMHYVDFGLGYFQFKHYKRHDVIMQTWFSEKGEERLRDTYDL